MTPKPDARVLDTGLTLYTKCARRSGRTIIATYSTSFSLACRLLDKRMRPHIESVYGLVRLADEIVDGAAAEAGLEPDAQRAVLDALERDTLTTMASGYSANFIVHAFAQTSWHAQIESALVESFFASMRRDLDPAPLGSDELAQYIYGSAEAVGLMCLRVFLVDVPADAEKLRRLEAGARHLGAAFQKINFLRDIASDWFELRRNYFPDCDPDRFSEDDKQAALQSIVRDLAGAQSVLDELPRGARTAVTAAYELFRELTRRLAQVPAPELLMTRVRVPNATKLRLLARSQWGRHQRAGT